MKKSNIGRRVVKGIGNGIFALVLLFCLALSVSFLLLDGNTFLGKRFGVIQSESMTASGYLKNDIVYIQDASLIEVGDVIVFYWAPDQYEAVDFDEKKHRFGFMKWSLLKTKTDLFLTLRKEAAMKRMTVCISRRALFWAKRYYCLLFFSGFFNLL